MGQWGRGRRCTNNYLPVAAKGVRAPFPWPVGGSHKPADVMHERASGAARRAAARPAALLRPLLRLSLREDRGAVVIVVLE